MYTFKGVAWVLLVIAIMSMCSCTTTRYVSVPEVHRVDSVVTRLVRDSVFKHDSVFVKEYVSGDTVYQEKTAVRYVYKWNVMRDTVQVSRRDSVPYPVEKRVEVFKYQTRWYDKICRRFTLIVLGGVGLSLLVWLARKKLKR